MLLDLVNKYEKEFGKVMKRDLVYVGCEYVLKCSHIFNLLDARKAISVAQRTSYITRVRNLAKILCLAYLNQRKEQDYPLLKKK